MYSVYQCVDEELVLVVSGLSGTAAWDLMDYLLKTFGGCYTRRLDTEKAQTMVEGGAA